MADTVDIKDAVKRLPDLVERAAAGEKIVISRNGQPFVRLEAVAVPGRSRPWNASGVRHIVADFDEPDAEIERLIRADHD